METIVTSFNSIQVGSTIFNIFSDFISCDIHCAHDYYFAHNILCIILRFKFDG
jgi:hypothetical protein